MYSIGPSENLALQDFAHQSSTLADQTAALAVDGDPLTCMSTQPEVGPWWQVDLGNFYHVTGVKIFTRTDAACLSDESCRE